MGNDFYFYKIEKIIGKGSFGRVYKVKHLRDGKKYAMKKIRVYNKYSKDLRNIVSELRILAFNKCPYLLSMVTVYMGSGDLCIITDYADGGDLYQKIENHRMLRKRISESTVWNYFCQMILGVKYLHEHNIIHRDLKTANILLFNREQTIQIADFGISRILPSKKTRPGTQIGTPRYMGPELMSSKPYTFQIDMWALGCILYEMLNMKPAFKCRTWNALRRMIVKGKYTLKNDPYFKQFELILSNLLQIDPDKRWTVDNLLSQGIIVNKIIDLNLTTDFERTRFKKVPLPRGAYGWNKTVSHLIPDKKSPKESPKMKKTISAGRLISAISNKVEPIIEIQPPSPVRPSLQVKPSYSPPPIPSSILPSLLPQNPSSHSRKPSPQLPKVNHFLPPPTKVRNIYPLKAERHYNDVRFSQDSCGNQWKMTNSHFPNRLPKDKQNKQYKQYLPNRPSRLAKVIKPVRKRNKLKLPKIDNNIPNKKNGSKKKNMLNIYRHRIKCENKYSKNNNPFMTPIRRRSNNNNSYATRNPINGRISEYQYNNKPNSFGRIFNRPQKRHYKPTLPSLF